MEASEQRPAKQALTCWVGLLKDAPPEATSSTWDEVAATFAAGRAAQGWVYGENAAWIATDASRSKVVGNVGVALPPTDEGHGSGRGQTRAILATTTAGLSVFPILPKTRKPRCSGSSTLANLGAGSVGHQPVLASLWTLPLTIRS